MNTVQGALAERLKSCMRLRSRRLPTLVLREWLASANAKQHCGNFTVPSVSYTLPILTVF